MGILWAEEICSFVASLQIPTKFIAILYSLISTRVHMKEAKISRRSGEMRLTSPARRTKNLSEALRGEWLRVESLAGPEDACYRLLELGFTPGAEVKISQIAPLGEPLVVALRGTKMALRKDEAAWIIVE